MLDYMVLKPEIEVLKQQVLTIAEAVDKQNALFAEALKALEAHIRLLGQRVNELSKEQE